jgi:hypothetical protein
MKNRIFLLLGLFLLTQTTIFAQISHGGIPFASKQKLPFPTLQLTDNTPLYLIDSSSNKDCMAKTFGFFLEMKSQLGDDLWETTSLEDGGMLYRMAVKSEGALAVSLYFKDVYIPNGAEIFVYDPDLEEVYGSYNSENNSESGFFNTEMIKGEEIVLEFYEPKSVVGEGRMTLKEVFHVFDKPFTNEEKGYGDSDFCEIDVKCAEGFGKENQRDAVVRLLIKQGEYGVWCTGSLINNTRMDKTPYLITADHCGNESSTSDMNEWRFYFDYQTNECFNTTEEPELKTLIGCEKIAASSNANTLGSDFFLVLLKEEVPEEYNPYFLGWNREETPSSEGFCIHHPQGDIKKISTFLNPAISANYNSNGISNGFWQVTWGVTVNGHGVTEPGSSGSPLFDEDGYLVGTLTGGGASCSSQTSPDFYGKFSVHWEDNGSNEDEQLAPWLDPDNTGQMKLAGVYLSLDELDSEEKGFSLIPNPAREFVEIRFEEYMQNVQVDLIHVNGQVLHTYYFSDSSSINISSLPKGIYLIRVTHDKNTYIEKLIKE